MKCRKCNLVERHESLAYCLPCNSAYLKEYRAKKKLAMDQDVSKPADDVQVAEESSKPSTSQPEATPSIPYVVPLFASYYVRQGTAIHRQLLQDEQAFKVV